MSISANTILNGPRVEQREVLPKSSLDADWPTQVALAGGLPERHEDGWERSARIFTAGNSVWPAVSGHIARRQEPLYLLGRLRQDMRP